jgi:hypothetical protein
MLFAAILSVVMLSVTNKSIHLIGPICKLQRKCSVVKTVSGSVFTKLFCLIYEWAQQARVFVPDVPLHPSAI